MISWDCTSMLLPMAAFRADNPKDLRLQPGQSATFRRFCFVQRKPQDCIAENNGKQFSTKKEQACRHTTGLLQDLQLT
ncbi:hypothetical protein WJX77_005724 [Trebouxia sp. C0004]